MHQIALVVHGIHLLENLRLDEPAAKRVHEFLLTLQPLKIKGGARGLRWRPRPSGNVV